jgi:hypothetical protein
MLESCWRYVVEYMSAVAQPECAWDAVCWQARCCGCSSRAAAPVALKNVVCAAAEAALSANGTTSVPVAAAAADASDAAVEPGNPLSGHPATYTAHNMLQRPQRSSQPTCMLASGGV